MFLSQIKKPIALGLGMGLMAVSVSYLMRKKNDKAAIKNNCMVGFYLTSDAQNSIKKYVKDTLDLDNGNSKLVVISHNPSDEDEFVYSALYNTKGAFRLKGLLYTHDIKNENNIYHVCGIGIVSTMGGKITSSTLSYKDNNNDNLLLSLPILDPSIHMNKSDLYDSINLLKEFQDNKNDIIKNNSIKENKKLRLVSKNNMQQQVQIKYVPIDSVKQLVIGGRICSNLYAKTDGSCDYDIRIGVSDDNNDVNDIKKEVVKKVEVKEEIKEEIKSIQETNTTTTDNTTDNKDDNKDDKDECPVCAFVKKGSCKAEFIKLQEYHDMDPEYLKSHQKEYQEVAQTMYSCMAADEYYDAFVIELKDQVKSEREEKNNQNNNNNKNDK